VCGGDAAFLLIPLTTYYYYHRHKAAGMKIESKNTNGQDGVLVGDCGF